jgi:hypothetical protein
MVIGGTCGQASSKFIDMMMPTTTKHTMMKTDAVGQGVVVAAREVLDDFNFLPQSIGVARCSFNGLLAFQFLFSNFDFNCNLILI